MKAEALNSQLASIQLRRAFCVHQADLRAHFLTFFPSTFPTSSTRIAVNHKAVILLLLSALRNNRSEVGSLSSSSTGTTRPKQSEQTTCLMRFCQLSGKRRKNTTEVEQSFLMTIWEELVEATLISQPMRRSLRIGTSSSVTDSLPIRPQESASNSLIPKGEQCVPIRIELHCKSKGPEELKKFVIDAKERVC